MSGSHLYFQTAVGGTPRVPRKPAAPQPDDQVSVGPAVVNPGEGDPLCEICWSRDAVAWDRFRLVCAVCFGRGGE